MLKGTLKRMSH